MEAVLASTDLTRMELYRSQLARNVMWFSGLIEADPLLVFGAQRLLITTFYSIVASSSDLASWPDFFVSCLLCFPIVHIAWDKHNCWFF